MVYVINFNGRPLMPTCRHGKVRRLLKEKKAKVIKRCPFTIQLLYEAEEHVQPVTLGVDAGSKTIGLSATTEAQELYAAEVQIRNDIVDLLSSRREMRRGRRYRKKRYRAPRFSNRVSRKKKGWLAPSVENKIEAHIRAVQDVHQILPVSHIIVEVASFDIQKIKNPDIQGEGYQKGEQLGFWNVREYVLFRDGHQCQCCKGKSKDKILNVHHIESRKTGGNAPSNLITLCETCHTSYHKGLIDLPKRIRRGMTFRDAAFMGIMRWTCYYRLKEIYGESVSMTFGYLTKNTRITNGLEKTHYIDARCISGNPKARELGYYFFQKKVRNHNRQLHKMKVNKGGKRKSNQAAKYVKGFALFDKVRYQGQECFIFGRRTSGYFDIRNLNGEKLSASVSYKKLRLLERGKSTLTERRKVAPPTA